VSHDEGRRVARFTRWDDLATVRAFTDELIRLWAERLVPMDVLTTYAYGRLYMQALRGQATVERQRLPAIVQRIREVIEKRYATDLSIYKMARLAGCSEPYLHELFKKHLGTSPHQLIVETRLKEASRRLASTRDPIKQIAHDTGFSHSPAFCHAFKNYTGLTPAVYRRQSYMP
jgi:AraC-like DNA-binding protein